LPVTSDPATLRSLVSDADDPIETAWSALLNDWESDDRHRAFVALAASLQRLPDAARHYRAGLDDAARGARSKAGIDAVLRVAYLALSPPPRGEHEITRRAKAWLLPMSVAMALVVTTLLTSQALHRPALSSPWVLAAESLAALLIPWHRLRLGGE